MKEEMQTISGKTLIFQSQIAIKKAFEEQRSTIIQELIKNPAMVSNIDYIGMGVQFSINILNQIEGLTRQQLKGAEKDFVEKMENWKFDKAQVESNIKSKDNQIKLLTTKIDEYEKTQKQLQQQLDDSIAREAEYIKRRIPIINLCWYYKKKDTQKSK